MLDAGEHVQDVVLRERRSALGLQVKVSELELDAELGAKLTQQGDLLDTIMLYYRVHTFTGKRE